MGPSTRKIRKTVENRKSQFSGILKKCSRIFFKFFKVDSGVIGPA